MKLKIIPIYLAGIAFLQYLMKKWYMNEKINLSAASVLEQLANIENSKSILHSTAKKAELIYVDGLEDKSDAGYLYILYATHAAIPNEIRKIISDDKTSLLNKLELLNEEQTKAFYNIKEGIATEIHKGTFAELYYGKRKIALLAPPSNKSFHLTRIHYDGGQLNASEFQLIEYTHQEESSDSQILVIAVKPKLTELEKDIVAKVSDKLSSAHLYDEPDPVYPGVAAALVVAATIIYSAYKFVAEHAGMITRQTNLTSSESLSPEISEKLKNMDPNLAVQELLKIRAGIIQSIK